VAVFRNTGRTHQRGLEAALSGWLWREAAPLPEPASNGPVLERGLRAWASYAYNDFRFGSYPSGTQDLGGNRLTGTTPHTLSVGLDFSERRGFYFSPNLGHQAHAGLDNATDRRYSLGNDLNAFGGRYFQPAPGRAWYGGAQLGWRF
jgi:iron complex outermembrane receptor protein